MNMVPDGSQSSADVTVFGLLVPTCVLHDIGMDVAHQTVAVIPADKALKSRDLWRSIGQKHLLRLHGGPGRPYPPVQVPVPDTSLLERAKNLEEENRLLRERLDRQAKEFAATQRSGEDKLDAILTLLKNGIPVSAILGGKSVDADTVVASEAPTFIPTIITPEGAESRIEPKKGESQSTSVSGAAERLRELRRKGGQ